MMPKLLLIAGIYSCFLVSNAQYLTTPYEENNPTPFDAFDFIIVGGGPTGIIVAVRLAEHPSNFSGK